MSEVPSVWQLQRPKARTADITADAKGLAQQYCWSNCRSMWFGPWSATGPKCSQVNPKFPLTGPPALVVVAARPQPVRLRRFFRVRDPSGPLCFQRFFGLIDELSAEFVTDPPCQ